MLIGFILGFIIGSIGSLLVLCFLIGARQNEYRRERNMRRMMCEDYVRCSEDHSEAA